MGELFVPGDREFVSKSRILLNDFHWYDSVYRLKYNDRWYVTFLDFLTQELDNLPFNNEIGETILMRRDAKEVVGGLASYLKNELNMTKER